MKKGKIMAIGAHFDDVEINCGGTLAAAQSIGYDIMIIVAGDGFYIDRNKNISRTAQSAKKECVEALKKLNLTKKNLFTLNYKETKIPFNAKIIKKIENKINTFKPDIIFTHSPHDSHQDHYNTSRNVLAASRYRNNVLFWESIFPSKIIYNEISQPNIYVDISDSQKQKINAIKCYKSQIKKFNDYKLPWLEAITSRSKYRGVEIGCKHAEAFYTIKYKIIL